MKLFQVAKDGGEKSHVTGLFLVEIKSLFSIVLLRFEDGTREAYHSHAFNALTWIVRGEFQEHMLDGRVRVFSPSLNPKWTPRSTFHKVFSVGTTYAISFRGPWSKTWREFLPATKEFVTLTHGRKIVA